MKISFAELHANGEIISCNNDFNNMFNVTTDSEGLGNIYEILAIPHDRKTKDALKQLDIGEEYNFLLVINAPKPNRTAIMIIYAYIYKQHKNKLRFYTTNYLSWLHNISKAKNHVYNSFTQLNKLLHKDIFTDISQVHAFKALHPLFITPKSYFGKLYANSMLDTAKIFFTNKEPSRTNDYIANVLGTISKELNAHIDTKYLDWQEGIANSKYNIEYKDEYYIPCTQVKHAHVMQVPSDGFLNNLLTAITLA